jgi:4-carboxymuconolactone decarboxylase
MARGEKPRFPDPDAALLHRFATEVLEDHFVADETFAEGLERFGEQGLVDLIGSLGNFSMLAMLLNTFQVDLQPDREPPFPDVRGYRRTSR